MSETILIALIVSVISPMILSVVMFFAQRANKREDWKRQDAVALAVTGVAETAAKAQDTLLNIAKTGEATHKIVNSQRTVMLRAIAVLSRAQSDDHPEDMVRRRAADDAERDLAENLGDNL